MNCWKYENGQLEPAEFDWPDGMSLNDAIRRNGFDPEIKQKLGPVDTMLANGMVEIYSGDLEGGNAGSGGYLVFASIGAGPEWVLIPNLPALLAFLRELAPVLDLALRSQEREELAVHIAWHDKRPGFCCTHRLQSSTCSPGKSRDRSTRRRR